MPAKSKQSTGAAEKEPSVRKRKPTVARAQMVDRSKTDLNQQWEQIRVRGEEISADIKMLLARLS